MTKAKRILKDFNFDTEGAAVALVGKFQGGPANGVTTLVTKSVATASEEEIQKALGRDVSVKMSIMEFLTRYLDLYWSDAEIVAGLLGYSPEDIDAGTEYTAQSYVEYIEQKLSLISINKSAESEKFQENFKAFTDKYLQKNLSSSVESEGGDVVTQTEDEPTEKEVNKMADEVTQATLQDMIAKAAADIAKDQVTAMKAEMEVEKAALTKELDVLKAAHEHRVHQEYLVKAAEFTQFLGEGADAAAIAKALRAAEGSEEAAPLMDVLKSLKEIAAKGGLTAEVGKSATQEQPSDIDSQSQVIAKSLMEKDPTLTVRQAEMKAFEQLAGQSL